VEAQTDLQTSMKCGPTPVTNAIIAINLLIYAILAILSQSLDISQNVLIKAGAQQTAYIEATGQYWRIFTAMFLHLSILHVGLNMLSLFFIGRVVETFYGHWRYLVIYLVSGIVGGIATFFLQPDAWAVGASGAIFGVFGALGVFYVANRRAMGSYGAGSSGWHSTLCGASPIPTSASLITSAASWQA
jgi:membrane associated rhomboid family serine protease